MLQDMLRAHRGSLTMYFFPTAPNETETKGSRAVVQGVVVPGSNKGTYTPSHLVHYIASLEEARLRQLLRFITGTATLPFCNYSKLHESELPHNTSVIVVHCMPRCELLPSAHTCFNTLDLPDYGCYETLCTKMDQALNNVGQEFDSI